MHFDKREDVDITVLNLKEVVDQQDKSFWSQKLKESSRGWIVLRPVLVEPAQYIQHLENMKGWQGGRIDAKIIEALKNRMKGKYWMVEVSYPELFPANRRKLGEILLCADVAPALPPNYQSFFVARLPERLYGFVPMPDKRMGLINYPSGIGDHVPVFSLAV